jgi:serine/threonine protein kinase
MPEETDDTLPHQPSEEDVTELLTPPTGGGSILPASAAPLREVIGDFEVQAKLGSGGMGAVYRARQISLGRMVALKILPAHMIEDADAVSRFQREARVAASLSHAHLVRVYSAGEADGCHYIAMELIEGEDLGRRLKRDGRLPAPEALRICADVARGLEHAWQTAHLIHRDIKPANIFLSANGEVKIGDLGLAKSILGNTTGLTQTGTMMGTPHYISPEQARADREIDFRADIYSLGCTLYQMLTGAVPYGGTDAITIIRQHLDAPLPAILKAWPQCPVPLARLVGRMLKKSRHERPASYAELITQIESVWAQIDPVSYNPKAFAPPPPPDPEATLLDTPATPRATATVRPSAPPPKSKTPLYAALAAGGVILGLAAFLLWPKPEKLTKAQLYARQRAAEQQPSAAAQTATPAPSRAAGDWHDWIAEQRRTDLLTKSGVFQDEGTSVRVTRDYTVNLDEPRFCDGAVRVRATLPVQPPKNLSITLRRDNDRKLSHSFTVNQQGKSINLNVHDFGALKWNPVQTWPLPPDFQPGQEFLLEARALGSTLSISWNGRELGRVQSSVSPSAGGIGLGVTEGTQVRKFEYQILDSSTATAEPWQDVLRDPARLQPLPPEIERTPQGSLRFSANRAVILTAQPVNGALRVRTTYEPEKRTDLRVRMNGQGFYQASLSSTAAELTRRNLAEKSWTPFGRFPLGRTLKSGDEYLLEVRFVGDRLTLALDGRTIGAVTDATFPTGTLSAAVTVNEHGPHDIKSLEVLDLDKPGSASTANASASPAAATRDAPFVNGLGMKFVPVPITGGPTGGQRVLFSIWETRVQDYEVFAQEANQRWTKPDYEQGPTHPAVKVSWEDAQAFCAWLTERERKAGHLGANERYRLPNDHEWSCAVGLGDREDAAKLPLEKNMGISDVYPWGTAWPPPAGSGNFAGEEMRPAVIAKKYSGINDVLTGYHDGFVNTSPVEQFAANALGLYDLGGNVTQWCEDWRDPEHKNRVLRGGSWMIRVRGELLSSCRMSGTPAFRGDYNGFRLVLAPVP